MKTMPEPFLGSNINGEILKIEQFHATAFASSVEIAKTENTIGFTYMFCSSIYKSTACCYSKNDF